MEEQRRTKDGRVAVFDSNTKQFVRWGDQPKSFLGINRQNLPQTISSVARPAMEMGGAVGGSILGGGPETPIGMAAGAGGYAAGKAGADLLDRYMGIKKPIQNMKQAGQEIASDAGEGALAETTGFLGGKALGALKKPASKFAGGIGRIVSGVKPQMGERLFNDPEAFLSPTMKRSGEELGAVRSKLGMSSKPYNIEEVVDNEAGTARRTAKEMFDKLQSNKASSTDLMKGAQAVDDVIEATPQRQLNKRRMLFDLKRQFTDALKDAAPEERQKAKQFSQSALAGEFRKFFPVTKSGDVSVLRTLGLGAMEEGGRMAAVIPSLLQSPALSGAGIAAAGGAYKLLQDPTIRRAVIAAILGKTSQ